MATAIASGEPATRGGLSKKVAVVVGGGSGIGRAVAKAIAKQGANIVVADFDEARMERTVNEVLKLGTSEAAIALPTDIRSDASVRSLARDAIKSMGRVDIVLNAAGVLLQGKLEMISPKDWTWMLETNLLGPVRTTTAFLPHMSQRGSGHIINSVSFGGLVPGEPLTIPYDSGHAALAAFTEGLARRMEGTGVSISLFCPGSRGGRIGQNTRSRGMGRWLQPADGGDDGTRSMDGLAANFVDGLHHPRFLILGDPSEAAALRPRWDHVANGAGTPT
jgi:NAD(P)-dependent dehydrogenase (short-subunit alcohol dehydrogenase family)